MMYRRGFGALTTPPASIQTALQKASASSGVPLSILQALAQQESGYNPSAVSPAGAQGLLQIMPATGASLGLTNPFDPQANATAGAAYLAQLYRQYGDWNSALVAYNQGPGALASQGPYASSASYAAQILANAGPLDSSAALPDYSTAVFGDGGLTLDLSSFGLPSIDFSNPLVLAALALAGLGLVVWLSS